MRLAAAAPAAPAAPAAAAAAARAGLPAALAGAPHSLEAAAAAGRVQNSPGSQLRLHPRFSGCRSPANCTVNPSRMEALHCGWHCELHTMAAMHLCIGSCTLGKSCLFYATRSMPAVHINVP